jgi:hypothetical protein
MATTNQPSLAVVKKIQALAKIAADLRQGKDYNNPQVGSDGRGDR